MLFLKTLCNKKYILITLVLSPVIILIFSLKFSKKVIKFSYVDNLGEKEAIGIG